MRTSRSQPREERATELADPGAMEELHRREDDGIAVSLLWSRYSGRLRVVVEDRKVGASFTLDARADNALEVFYHPYAQATAHLDVAA